MMPWSGSAVVMPNETVHLRLYVAGNMLNSRQAVANISSICEEYLAGRYCLEIVDALEEPLCALRDDVMVAPTLVKLSPQPVSRTTGNLGQREIVLCALGLSGQRKDAALAEVESAGD